MKTWLVIVSQSQRSLKGEGVFDLVVLVMGRHCHFPLTLLETLPGILLNLYNTWVSPMVCPLKVKREVGAELKPNLPRPLSVYCSSKVVGLPTRILR